MDPLLYWSYCPYPHSNWISKQFRWRLYILFIEGKGKNVWGNIFQWRGSVWGMLSVYNIIGCFSELLNFTLFYRKYHLKRKCMLLKWKIKCWKKKTGNWSRSSKTKRVSFSYVSLTLVLCYQTKGVPKWLVGEKFKFPLMVLKWLLKIYPVYILPLNIIHRYLGIIDFPYSKLANTS